MAEVTMTLEEYQDLEDKLSTLAMKNQSLKKERDSFRKQRDELINDMQNVKRKAEVFDEIKVNLYHVKDLKPWETLDPKDHEFLRDIFNEIPSDWEADHEG